MSKQLLRWLGALMVLAGIGILAYAIYSYVAMQQLEASLEAQVPGQPTATVVALAPATVESPATPDVPTAILLRPAEITATPPQPLPTAVSVAIRPTTESTSIAPPTATAIDLVPRTAVPTDQGDIAKLGDKPTPQPTPHPFSTVAIIPTPLAAPTLNADAPIVQGPPLGSGSPAARIQIPKLNMDLEIRDAEYVTQEQNGSLVTDWNIPFDAAGHLNTTAQPGEIGNAVISGHHNLTGPGRFGLGKFAGLWNLVQGDEIRIQTLDGKTQLWRVKNSFPLKEAGEPLSVRIQHAQQVLGDTPIPQLTLLTCWNGKQTPLSGNTYRWVIEADLINIQ